MRTTLTLDPDVVRLIEEAVHRQRKPMQQVVNEALRRGLAPSAGRVPRTPYRVEPHRAALQPGIDADALNRLSEELEEDAAVEKTEGGR